MTMVETTMLKIIDDQVKHLKQQMQQMQVVVMETQASMKEL